MNSRERIRKTINHEEPDRVPLDLGGSKVTGIHIDEYCELARFFGADVLPAKVFDPWQMLAKPELLMTKCLKSDVIVLENPVEAFGLRNKDWKFWTTSQGNRVLMSGDFAPVHDENGVLRILNRDAMSLAKMPPGGLYFDLDCPTGLSETTEYMEPAVWKKSIPLYSEEELCELQKKAKTLFESTDLSICGSFLKGGLGTNALFAGHTISDWLCILACEKQHASEILQATAERAVENLALYLQAVGAYIDTVVLTGTDYGTQKGELFDPQVFEELYVPNYKLMTDYIHGNSRVKAMMHSCGSIYNLMEHIIAAGIDILNPIHVSTANMDPRRLKERFGARIVFWGGGVDTQTVLPFGTPEEVAEQARERIEIFAPGGGFVFTPVHNMQYGVPPQNVQAMIEAVINFGEYPMLSRRSHET